MKARTRLSALACAVVLLHTAHAASLREGEYTGMLQCGPRLSDATYGGWTEPLHIRITSTGMYWRREDPNMLEEGEVRARDDGFEFAGVGQLRGNAASNSRWVIVGRFSGPPDAIRGVAKLINAETKKPSRECTLGASWKSAPMPVTEWDAGRNPPAPTPEMTFFGYQMDGLSPRWRGPSDSGWRLLAGTKYWEDTFQLSEEKTPNWLVGPMTVTLQTTGDGRIREAKFELNTFQNDKEMMSPAVRTQKMTALITLMTDKFGGAPDSRSPAPWKLTVPWDQKTRLPTEVATWTRPWGTARLFSCSYGGYRQECPFDGFVPSLHVETKTRINARAADQTKELEQKTRSDASRVKL